MSGKRKLGLLASLDQAAEPATQNMPSRQRAVWKLMLGPRTSKQALEAHAPAQGPLGIPGWKGASLSVHGSATLLPSGSWLQLLPCETRPGGRDWAGGGGLMG